VSRPSRSRLRVLAPFVAAAVCLVVSGFTGSTLTMVLVVAAFMLVFDGATLLWSKSGGLSEFKQ